MAITKKNIFNFMFAFLFAGICYGEDQILAKVNDKPIYESEIRDRIEKYIALNGNIDRSMSYDSLDTKIKQEIIKSIVLGDLILVEAEKAKTAASTEYKQSLDFLKKQLLQKYFIEQLVKSAVTEDKIKQRYQQIIAEYTNKEEYKVSHILLNSEEEAKLIQAKLKHGEDFAKLAREHSIDNNKEEGGSLDYFSKGQMAESFEKAASELKIDEISDIVKTDFGYHLIKLEDKRKMKTPTIVELKAQISEELSNQFMTKYIEDLEAKNKVDFLNKD